jgi:hypothetical protein
VNGRVIDPANAKLSKQEQNEITMAETYGMDMGGNKVDLAAVRAKVYSSKGVDLQKHPEFTQERTRRMAGQQAAHGSASQSVNKAEADIVRAKIRAMPDGDAKKAAVANFAKFYPGEATP